MNGGKLPDGGILYDGTEDDDDEVAVEVEASRPGVEIDWHVDGLDETGLTGADLIAEFVKRLPNAPGVYRMLNKAGEVMYVGKARSLKKRVSKYAQGRVHSNRLSRMVRDTV
ncbi:MAG: GIY-YIG nuclease family protein, partial [Allorhizobium sp.]